MKPRRSLQTQIMRWLRGYAVVLGAVILLFLADEFLEDRVWEYLLKQELAEYRERKAADPGHVHEDTGSLRIYTAPERPPPPAVDGLAEGIYDDFWLDGRENVVLVHRLDGIDHVVALDITDLEVLEDALILVVLGLAVFLLVAMGVLVTQGLRRSLHPLSQMAETITALVPDRSGQRVPLAEDASTELHVIAGALNDYLRRQEEFIERERAFNNTASHELRTPIAVIAGALELALEQPSLPATARGQVQRALHAARNVEQLVALLLTLAKDPARLSRSSEIILLHELLPDIILDHQYLLGDKALSIVVDSLAACTVEAPMHIVQAAIGNLLRNAIENSDRGTIRVRLDADAIVTIEDPGHGMSPEEIGRIYKQLARGGRSGDGIGLDLLARLCEHLGWTLTFSSAPGAGTVSQLRLANHGGVAVS